MKTEKKITKNWNETETEKIQWKTKLKLKNISQLKSHCVTDET